VWWLALTRTTTSSASSAPKPARHVWWLALLALLVVVLVSARSLGGSSGAGGIAVGEQVPPFAVPLALGTLSGDANVATRPNDGAAGRIPACDVHLPQALNICRDYARSPLVLALFVNGGSCPSVLGDLQRLGPAFPGVQIAAVAIRGDRAALRSRLRRDRIRFPVGYVHDGVLADLYRVSSCPQVSFVAPGGRVAVPSLLGNTTPALLRSRTAALVADARAHGWSPAP
jgi:hypothetical protein